MRGIAAYRGVEQLRRSSRVFFDLLPCSFASLTGIQQSASRRKHSCADAATAQDDSSNPSDFSSEVERGQALLVSWQSRKPEAIRCASEDEVRGILRAAVGLQRNRAPQITDQLQQLVMRLYAEGSQGPGGGRENFLRVICQDFGVQGRSCLRNDLLARRFSFT